MNKLLKDRRVCVVASGPPHLSSILPDMLSDYFREEGALIFRVRANPSLPGFISRIDNWVISPISRVGIALIRFPSFMKDLIPKEISSEVIHIHTFSYAGFFYTPPSILVGKILRKKIVITYHGGAAYGFLHKWKLFALPFLKAVDIIITPSGFIKKILRDFGVTKKIEIIPNIVDLSSFEYRERNPIRPRLLIARHLEKIYNIECGIRAFQIVKDRFPDAELKILGTGSEEKKLKELVRELKLQNVQFIPRVEHDKMNLMYEGSDILVNPTTADNFPVNCIEAAASGLPIVSTNVGGIPFIINDGEEGLLVASNDHEDMAKKIIYLLENPEEALRLALSAREAAERRTWKYVRTKYASILG